MTTGAEVRRRLVGLKSLSLIIDSQASEPKNLDPHDVVFLGKALAMNNAPSERTLH